MFICDVQQLVCISVNSYHHSMMDNKLCSYCLDTFLLDPIRWMHDYNDAVAMVVIEFYCYIIEIAK